MLSFAVIVNSTQNRSFRVTFTFGSQQIRRVGKMFEHFNPFFKQFPALFKPTNRSANDCKQRGHSEFKYWRLGRFCCSAIFPLVPHNIQTKNMLIRQHYQPWNKDRELHQTQAQPWNWFCLPCFYCGNKTLFYVSFAKETWHSCFRCVSRPILQKHDKVLNFEWLMLPGISVSMWDRIHRACAYELYSQQTVSTHQRCSS